MKINVRSRTILRARPIGLLAAATMLLTGCGATVAGGGSEAESERFPVKVTNCGQQRTYEQPPRRVVTYDSGITEIMFALGLEDRMVGYFLGDGQRRDVESSPWREKFKQVPRIGEDVSMEGVRSANADFVFAGWNYGFGETERFTPKRLKKAGIAPYVLTESCRNGKEKQRGIMPPLQALYTDIRNMGELFDVSDRAQKLIDKYKSTIAATQQNAPKGEQRPDVFLYDAGTKQPITSGNGGAAHQIIAKAGGRNIFSDLDDSWTSVSWETVVRADPDVILINDYGDKSVRDKIDFLTGHPALSRITAVREKRFFDLPYAALVEGPRNASAVERFGEYLRQHD